MELILHRHLQFPPVLFPFIVVTLRPYFKSIPVSLDEAARIDGCNVFRSFFKIMIPTIKNRYHHRSCYLFLKWMERPDLLHDI